MQKEVVLPETYQPFRGDIPYHHTIPETRLEQVTQQFVADGIVRVAQIEGVLRSLRSFGILSQASYPGEAVALGCGTGADIVACERLGYQAIGVDDRSMTEGYIVGSWCPIPEFVKGESTDESSCSYKKATAKEFLEGKEEVSVSLITAFDAAPSMLEHDLATLIETRLVKNGIFLLTQRDYSNSDIKGSGMAFSAQMSPIILPKDFAYLPTLKCCSLTDLFPQYSHSPVFRRYITSAVTEAIENTRYSSRDRVIEVWRKR